MLSKLKLPPSQKTLMIFFGFHGFIDVMPVTLDQSDQLMKNFWSELRDTCLFHYTEFEKSNKVENLNMPVNFFNDGRFFPPKVYLSRNANQPISGCQLI